MGIRLNESLRAVGLAALVVGAAAAGIACGGDDDNGGVNTSTSGTPGSTSGTSGTSGSTSTSSGSTTSSSGSTTSSSSSSSSGENGPQAATPVLTPKGGTFQTPQSVTISDTTPGAEIHFTLDGTNPTVNSVVYANPIAVAKDTTIRAMAVATGFTQSGVAAESYVIQIPNGTTKPVDFLPPAGEYNNPVQVGLSTQTAPSTICYTIDNSAPTCTDGACTGTSATYNAGSPIPVDAPTGGGKLTVKALACSKGNNNSEPTSADYTFRAAAPTSDTPDGTVAFNKVVAIHTATAGIAGCVIGQNGCVSIHYETNPAAADPTCTTASGGAGGTPSADGQTLTFTIKENTTIRAVACRGNYQDSSPLKTFTYTVKLDTPTFSATKPNGGDATTPPNNNTLGSTTNTKFNSITPVAVDNTGAPPTKLCFRVGADPVCATDGTCDTSVTNPTQTSATLTGGEATGPAVDTNLTNNIRVRACGAKLLDSDVAQATYTFTVQNVSITPSAGLSATTAPIAFCGSTPTPGCYEPTSGSSLYNNNPGGVCSNNPALACTAATAAAVCGGANTCLTNRMDVRFGTAKPGQDAATAGQRTAAQTTGTTGETVRYAFKTGTTLPQPANIDCGGTDADFIAAAPGDNHAVCTPDSADSGANPCTITLAPFTTVKAIGCKGNYVSSPPRTLLFADPNATVGAPVPTPAASAGPFNNDTPIDFTTSPTQPTNAKTGGSDVHVCWTTSVNSSITPTCDQVSGLCTAPTGAQAGDSWGEYGPCADALPDASPATCTTPAPLASSTVPGDQGYKKPLIFQTGTILKAVACQAGKNVTGTMTPATYQLQVAKPTFNPPSGPVGFDAPINFVETTTGATINYRRSNTAQLATDPSCATGIPNQVDNSTFIDQFDNDCGDGLSASTGNAGCAPTEQVKLIACKAGYLPSEIATGDFTTKLQDPTIVAKPPATAPVAGSRHNEVVVTISDVFFTGLGPTNARVCYTTDGTTPQCSGTDQCAAPGGTPNKITAPTDITVGTMALPSGTTVKAIACAQDYPPSGGVSASFSFAVQAYSISPVPGMQSGGAKSITFTNKLPADDGTPGSGFKCVGGATPGAACTGNTANECGDGGVCANDPTITATDPLVLCYSTDGTAIPADCTEIGTDKCVGGTAAGTACTAANEATVCTGGGTCSVQKVFCSNGLTNGATVDTFDSRNGMWAPTNLQNIGASINQLRSKACRKGFTATTERNDQYTFGPYNKALDLTNSSTEQRLDDSSAQWGSTNNTGAAGATNNAANDKSVAATNSNYMSVSYTDTNIYLAFQGSAITSNANEYLSFYVKGGVGGVGGLDATASGTTTQDQRGGGFPANEFGDQANPGPASGYNYHFFMRPADGTSSAKARVWNGTTWIDPVTAPTFTITFSGTLGGPSALVVFTIPRAQLGLTAATSHLQTTGLIWDGVAAAGNTFFPAASSSEKPAGKAWKWLDADMGSALFPSDRSYIKP